MTKDHRDCKVLLVLGEILDHQDHQDLLVQPEIKVQLDPLVLQEHLVSLGLRETKVQLDRLVHLALQEVQALKGLLDQQVMLVSQDPRVLWARLEQVDQQDKPVLLDLLDLLEIKVPLVSLDHEANLEALEL